MLSLKDQRFGRLLVKELVRRDTRGHSFWRCLCDCGTLKEVRDDSLRSKKHPTESCGCLAREVLLAVNTKHGMAGTPEYNAYLQAQHRCTNSHNPRWRHYGGRGIKFLFVSFEQFFNELGPRPEGKSLDRRDNNGNYEPGNVKWSTDSEQNINRRTSRRIE